MVVPLPNLILLEVERHGGGGGGERHAQGNLLPSAYCLTGENIKLVAENSNRSLTNMIETNLLAIGGLSSSKMRIPGSIVGCSSIVVAPRNLI